MVKNMIAGIVTIAGITKWLIVFSALGAGLSACTALFTTNMPGKSHSGPLPPLTEEEVTLSANLKTRVEELASRLGERNLFTPGSMDSAAHLISRHFENLGYAVELQPYTVHDATVYNISVELRGSDQPEEILVLGAHYDSVFGTRGANDNGSGTAGLLELARLMKDRTFSKTVRFVAFANEEPPFFQTGEMGSLIYAKACAKRQESIVGMLSIETIGYYSDEKKSQQYPFPFSLYYPSVGNFIGFVGDRASGELLMKTVASFRTHTQFPSEGLSAPGWITGVGWSDHWSFWQANYPGIMITDTAPFRYPYYHTAMDTADKLDYDRMARVVAGLSRVIADLAGRVE